MEPMAQTGGLVVAGLGRRIGAWIVDAFLASLLAIVPFSVAVASGAASLNSRVLDQFAANSHATIAEPLLVLNMPVVIAAVAVWIILRAAYFAGCWTFFRGTVGQRMLSLEVVAVENSESLSLGRAIVRWLALEGIGQIVSAVALLMVANVLASVPFSQTTYGAAFSASTVDSRARAADSLSSVGSWGSIAWAAVLLVSAGANSLKRGFHDRLAGSIVLGKAPRGWTGYPQWGPAAPPSAGYPQAGYPAWPTAGGYPQGGYPQGGYLAGRPPTGYPPAGNPQAEPPQTPAPGDGLPPAPPADGPTA
jgi:uncharacterized RDD family membrane protein YckC